MPGEVTSEGLHEFVFDSPHKFQLISFNLLLQFFNGRSEFATAVGKTLSTFPEALADPHLRQVLQLTQDLDFSSYQSYFRLLQTGSFYLSSFLSFKTYLFKVRSLQLASLRKVKTPGLLKRR
jgi:hypothetical protein